MSELIVYVGVNSDDCYWSANRFSTSVLFIGQNNYNESSTCVFRFPNITIPKGSTITSAVLRLTADMYSGQTTVNVRVRCNDVDNAVAPTTKEQGAALVLTSEYVNWSSLPAWQDKSKQDTPDIKAVIKEVIDREGWVSGNALMVALVDNSSSTGAARIPFTHDYGNSNYYAKLTINYTEPPPPMDVTLDAELEGISGDIELYNDEDRSLSVSSVLEGITGSFVLEEILPFTDINVSFYMVEGIYEDISVNNQWNANYWDRIFTEFYVGKPGFYNYTDIHNVFYITIGAAFQDINVAFSIILAPQSYSSYVMQKLYCVTREQGVPYADLELLDWNVLPNKTWYVGVRGLEVSLYDTLADLNVETNPVAQGTANEDTMEVVLYNVDEYDEAISFYYSDMLIHLSLSAVISGFRKFKVSPLTDMAELRNPIYNNFNIVVSKGYAELDLHTYAVIGKELVLGIHLPNMEPGEVVNHTSTRRGTAIKSQILSQSIIGVIGEDGSASLINTIKVANYMELSR